MLANPEKDPRLYFKMPNDFHRHPKVKRLSDAAFRVFVEMIGEARIEDNDGVFPVEDAEFLWRAEALDELVRSHPSRPLVVRDGNTYASRDYAKHQQTRADREEAARVARENGAKGGRPRKPRGLPRETKGVSDQNLTEPSETQTKPESESESEIEIHDLTVTGVSQVTNASEILTDEEKSQKESALRLALGIGVDLEVVIGQAAKLDRKIDHATALRLATHILAKANRTPNNPTGYLVTAFKNEPFVQQQWIDKEVRT